MSRPHSPNAALRRTSSLLLAAATFVAAPSAIATYSIVGVDVARREVGGSGTSCLGGQDVYVIYGSVPGVGVVHAQALLNRQGRGRAVSLLMQGLAPSEIVDALTNPSFDPDAGVRQYAVADVTGRVRAFTGPNTGVFAADRQGAADGFVYSVQGNILTGERVLTQAADAFEASGCDLAERLMLSLEAGANGGEGDSRCTGDGIPSDSAFVQVDREGEAAGAYLALRVPSSGDVSPLPELRALFSAWRTEHPCPAPDVDAGGEPMTDAGSGTSGNGAVPEAGGASAQSATESSGCGCSVVGRERTGGVAAALLGFACAGFGARLRRRS